MTRKLQTITLVTKFALIHLSGALHKMHQKSSMKSIAKIAKASPSVLSSIKNDRVRSISLKRVLEIIECLNLEYTLTTSLKNGVKHYTFEMDGLRHAGRSDRTAPEITTTFNRDYARPRTPNTRPTMHS